MSENLTFKEQSHELPLNLKGVIKPKKKLDDLTESVVMLLSDFYTAYFKLHQLEPIHDLKGKNALVVRDNPMYHTPLIAEMLILILVRSEQNSMYSTLLRYNYQTFIELQQQPYEAVSNMLNMFGLQWDENNIPKLLVKEEAEIEVTDTQVEYVSKDEVPPEEPTDA